MEKLSRRQAEILQWLHRYVQENDVPPTRAELMQAFAFQSPNAAESHLRTLERKGYLQLQRGRARGIRLTETVQQEGLPLVGRVAAGQPILSEENLESYLPTADRLFPEADFLLRVQGMSMRDAGILDGDLLAVQRCLEVHNGQIAVVRLDDEVTVKRWQQERERLWLLPENPDFAPIEVDLGRQALSVEGVVVGLIRRGGKL
ncbi:MAG: transcriptional repressor LexA [Acidithiobacillus sp.]|uniref:transcriptional repressor LexA n=1 Tax=Acidithiobacillus sp. TaxID=1872118 RepID=UPI003CFBCC87